MNTATESASAPEVPQAKAKRAPAKKAKPAKKPARAKAGKPKADRSLGFYATEPGKPAPVKLEEGKTTKISASFDDSFKMK